MLTFEQALEKAGAILAEASKNLLELSAGRSHILNTYITEKQRRCGCILKKEPTRTTEDRGLEQRNLENYLIILYILSYLPLPLQSVLIGDLEKLISFKYE